MDRLPNVGDREAVDAVRSLIASELEDRGMQRQDLAAILGRDASVVTRLLSGGRRMQLTELAAVEDALGLLRGYFLRGADLVRDPACPREALANDPNLSPWYRDEMVAAYDRAVEGTARRRSTRRPSR